MAKPVETTTSNSNYLNLVIHKEGLPAIRIGIPTDYLRDNPRADRVEFANWIKCLEAQLGGGSHKLDGYTVELSFNNVHDALGVTAKSFDWSNAKI